MEPTEKRTAIYLKSGMNVFQSGSVVYRIDLGTESLWFVTGKKTFHIKFVDLRIELYKEKHYSTAITGGSYPYYIYFSDVTDETTWLELKDSYFRLGAVLLKLSKLPGIQLGDREINFLTKFEREWREYNSPKGKLMRVLIPLAIIVVFLIVGYMCSGL